MRKSTGLYPSVHVDATAERVVAHGGASLLVATARKVGLDRGLSEALGPWMRPLAVHDPGKIVLDLAMALAIGGDCLADIAQLRAEPAVFGLVASDPTVSRLVAALASDSGKALAAIDSARAGARAAAWSLAGASHGFTNWLAGQGLSYTIGFGLTTELAEAIDKLPDQAWTPAYDSDAVQRDGAKIAELTGVVNLAKWPKGMRLIVRAERPHPGAQLRFTDINGWRLTAFVTNSEKGQLAQLELRHRRRARCEDRIRFAKDTGLQNLPLHRFAQNEIWLAIVALACALVAWMQMLALTGHDARKWEPKRLRLRLLSIPGTIARSARRTRLRLSARAPHVAAITTGLNRLASLAAPT